MTAASLAVVLVVLGGIVVFAVVLIRQGFPDSEGTLDDLPYGEGPTGEEYPPGSRPAGPGAETMHLEPSAEMHEERRS